MEISEGRESCITPVEEPPPVITSNAEPEGVDQPKRTIMMRPGDGASGREISLLANHLKVSIKCPDEIFYHYSVSITSDEKRDVNSKVIRRKIIDRLHETYSSEFAGKRFAYDGEKNLYTVGPLPRNRLEFTVVVEESSARHASESPSDNGSLNHSSKRSKNSLYSKAFLVEIDYAAKIPLRSVDLALQGVDPENVQDALRVLDIILRQQAANRGCLLVRQSFFHDDSRNFTDVGGGVMSCRGFHSSFRPTDGGLTLNMDVSTTMILSPGPVIDFLLANQNVKEPRYIDWARAKRMLKNLRVKAKHNNREFKIIGLTDRPCNQQLFSMKVKNGGSPDDGGETLEITVYEYFTKYRNIELSSSVYMPCLDVGKPKRPNYLPLELCYLVSLQRYTKALSSVQRASLVEKSRQKPRERIKVITDAVRDYSYDDDPFLVACGISIEKQLIQINGRVLDAPKLKVGNGEEVTPCDGRWNFKNKHLFNPARIERWAVVNFSASCDTSHLSRELISCGRSKGIHFERPHTLIEEDPQYRRAGAVVRVEQMFEEIIARLPGHPDFLLCVLPERKNSELYGPWKKKSLTDLGIVTQCISPLKITDRYLTNVLLKINAKLGGTNSLLAMEHTSHLPVIKDTPTMILGMDVSHGSPGQSDIPSIAAVVGSLYWPLISKYRAVVRSQSPKLEIIESLYKPLPNGDDEGIMRELLLDFYRTSNGHKPAQIIVFRDGVSESQFSQLLNLELDQMIKAYNHLGEGGNPKFTLIVAQKNHHTKLFQANAVDNVPPGTVVDTNIVHPRNNDFFMCAHAGMIGTTKPAHYHVLLDEIGFAPDVLQNLIHSLSYVYQRSTSATSIVAPVRYAHLAAQQFGQFDKFEDHSETSSEQGSVKSIGTTPVTELPRLHKNVSDSMFFC